MIAGVNDDNGLRLESTMLPAPWGVNRVSRENTSRGWGEDRRLIGESVLLSIAGSTAYEALERTVSALAPSDSDKLSARLFKAADQAAVRFFEEFKNAYPSPHGSFLARESNMVALGDSLRLDVGRLEPSDLDPRGFDGQPEATAEQLSRYVELLNEEIRLDHVLETWLSVHDHLREQEGVSETVDSTKRMVEDLATRFSDEDLKVLSDRGRFLRFIEGLDAQLLSAIRALEDDELHLEQSVGLRQACYEGLIRGAIGKKGLSPAALFQELGTKGSANRLAPENAEISLRLTMARGCGHLRIDVQGESVNVESPLLLWDCSCQAVGSKSPSDPDSRDEFSESCPIHAHPLGEEIQRRFRHGLVEICHDDVSILWRQGAEFWPPSIDALHMVEDLDTANVFAEQSRILDLGAGTGYLGIVAANKCAFARSVTLADWLMTPLSFSAFNWWRNEPREGTALRLEAGLNLDWVTRTEPDAFDLILCNPPYLPVPNEFRFLRLSSTVAGTELIEAAIQGASTLLSAGGRFFVSFSNIAAEEASIAAARVGRELVALQEEPRWVPFRVSKALEQKGYIDWLERERGLQRREGERYSHWHDVRTWELIG